jgi:hypothetical protein
MVTDITRHVQPLHSTCFTHSWALVFWTPKISWQIKRICKTDSEESPLIIQIPWYHDFSPSILLVWENNVRLYMCSLNKWSNDTLTEYVPGFAFINLVFITSNGWVNSVAIQPCNIQYTEYTFHDALSNVVKYVGKRNQIHTLNFF